MQSLCVSIEDLSGEKGRASDEASGTASEATSEGTGGDD
jgi:hypothetical protein